MKISRLMILSALLSGPTITACAADAIDTDWRRPDPANLVFMELPEGTVVMELATDFAPKNVANIKTLVREKYFDGLAIIRSQDNYVVQWGDPAADEDDSRSFGSAAASVASEFVKQAEAASITIIDSRDAYADVVGFAAGFPVGSDRERVWMTHCYGMVGVARGPDPGSGNGSSLYVVTGHAPRHLDRNITLVGRVISGIEHLTILPRGTGALGFYESATEMTPIIRMQLGSEIAADNRPDIEIMRTDSEAFSNYVKSRTYRHEDWFVDPTGKIEICNLAPPIRSADASR